jgi:hypothetical protein
VSIGRAVGGSAAPAAGATAATAATGAYSIDKVDFRRGSDGAGRIMVRTSE